MCIRDRAYCTTAVALLHLSCQARHTALLLIAQQQHLLVRHSKHSPFSSLCLDHGANLGRLDASESMPTLALDPVACFKHRQTTVLMEKNHVSLRRSSEDAGAPRDQGQDGARKRAGGVGAAEGVGVRSRKKSLVTAVAIPRVATKALTAAKATATTVMGGAMRQEKGATRESLKHVLRS